MTTGFILTAELAQRYFELCLEREAVTELEKFAILEELAHSGLAEKFQTEYGKATVVKKLSAIANVYKVTKRDNTNAY